MAQSITAINLFILTCHGVLFSTVRFLHAFEFFQVMQQHCAQAYVFCDT